MASNIVDIVLRVVNQGASAAVNGLQNAMNGLGGSAQQAGVAMRNAVSNTAQAAQQAASQIVQVARSSQSAVSSVQSAATAAGHAVQHIATAATHAAHSTQTAATSAVSAVQSAATQTGHSVVSAVSSVVSSVASAATHAAHSTQTAATSAVSAVQSAATAAGHAAQHTAQQVGQAAESMREKFVKLAAAIGALAFFKSSASEFAKFESAMLKVQALSGAVGKDFDALNAKAKELGASTKYTAVEAAEGMSQLAAAGYNATQILDAIAPALHAAAAGGSDLGETADQLTNIMGAFQLGADQAGRVADVLTKGFTGAATTMSQLAYAMKPAGAVAKALGYSLEETVAVLQSLANVGYKGEQAGTILRNAMSAFLNEKSANILKEYNVELKDAEGNVRKFVDILDDMKEAGVDTAKMFEIFGAEAGPGMLALLGQGADAIRDYEKALLNAGGQARKVSDHMESGLKGTLNRLDAAWSELRNSFGKAIAPAVSAVADALAALVGWFARMPDWAKQALALGTVLAVVAGSVGGIVSVVSAASAGFAALGVSMGGIASAVLGIAAAIGAAVAAWKAFGAGAAGAAGRHARAAAKIAGDIDAEKKRIQELRDLQKTLLETAPGTKEHVEAEQELAQILPGVNTHIDEQGRLVATLSGKTDENNRKLEEHIALLEKRNVARENERLRETALAYTAAADAVDRQARRMRELHDAARNANRDLVDLNTAMSGYDPARQLREGVKESEKLNASLEKQRGVLDGLLRSFIQSGTTVSQFNDKLGELGLPANAKARLVNEYIAVMRQVKAEAEKTSDEVAADQVATAKEASDEMKKAYKSCVDEVRRLQEEISGRQKSLTAELRDMARSGMNAPDAWVDQRNAAKEYIKLAKQAADEARRAQASGDTITAAQKWKEAVQYADDAKAAYKALNHEIKVGDQVVISAQTALKGAMRGVKEAGELGIGFLKEQEQAARSAAQALEKTHGFEALTADMDAAEKKWAESMRRMGDSAAEAATQVYNVWQNASGFWTNVEDEFSAGWSRATDAMGAGWETTMRRMETEAEAAARKIERLIDQATRARTVNIAVRENRRWGGLIGDALRLAVGGKLAGYGGGDKVPAMLEPGEFVVRKEAVRKFGAGLFEALNNLRLPDFSRLMPSLPAMPAMAAKIAAPAPGRAVNINLSLGGETWPMQTDERTAKKIERWYALRSSNRLARNDYR